MALPEVAHAENYPRLTECLVQLVQVNGQVAEAAEGGEDCSVPSANYS